MSLSTPPGDGVAAQSARPPLPSRRIPELRPEPGSALELVDSDFMVSALDTRWPVWTPGALDPLPPDLLLIDPLQRTAGPLMQALSGATGTALGRLRLLSPAGLREVARVEEIRLPAEPGLPSMVRLLHARRLPAGTPSPALERIWDRTRLAVLLAQGLPAAEATTLPPATTFSWYNCPSTVAALAVTTSAVLSVSAPPEVVAVGMANVLPVFATVILLLIVPEPKPTDTV